MPATRLNRGRSLTLAAMTVALAVPATAAAAEQADLRVEAGRPLAAAGYVTDTTKIKTTKSSSCQGSGDTKTIQGANALGLLWSAAAQTKSLRPVAVSDQYDFGLLVCGISTFVGGDTAYWLYKVDHKLPEVGAEQFPLKGGEEVLWYYSDTTANLNTGDELALQAPAKAKPDSTVKVRVWAYDATGKRTPAAGADGAGRGRGTTDAQGRATVETPAKGTLRLRAERGADIASQTAVRLRDRQGRLPVAAREEHHRQRQEGPHRWAGQHGSPTSIAVKGGGKDTVRCGAGKDRVSADKNDRVGRDCEVVKRG